MAKLTVTNPWNLGVVCEMPYDDMQSSLEKLDRAVQAQREWAAISLEERIAAVHKAMAYFRTHEEQICTEVSQQMGKPLAQSRGELATMFERLDGLSHDAPQALADDILPQKEGFERRIVHEPLGVILQIAPWNYPLVIPTNLVVGALFAGNAVLLKHSPLTPLCGFHFEKAFEGHVPDGLVANLILDPPMMQPLLQHPDVAFVSFTGSVQTGKQVYHTTAQRIVGVALELGGKDPAYVAEDADLEHAVNTIVDGACYNAGQSCCSIERAYVHAKHYDAFLEKARTLFQAYKLGNPLEEGTTMGPLARKEQPDFLHAQVAEAGRHNARTVFQGESPDGGHFFPPTLLADVPNQARVMQEESFGPVLPVAKVDGDDDALAKMNDSRLGLTAAVFTADNDRAEYFGKHLQAGTVFQNRCDYLDPALPWVGHKDSGLGCSLSAYGLHQLTKRKSIHFKRKL